MRRERDHTIEFMALNKPRCPLLLSSQLFTRVSRLGYRSRLLSCTLCVEWWCHGVLVLVVGLYCGCLACPRLPLCVELWGHGVVVLLRVCIVLRHRLKVQVTTA
jgi:hypothetical protein